MKKLLALVIASLFLRSAFAQTCFVLPPICDIRDRGFGPQVGLITLCDDGLGITLGGYNSVKNFAGVQIGAMSCCTSDFYGIQANAFSSISEECYGLQCATVNFTSYINGIQVGVLNQICHGGGTPFSGFLQIGAANESESSFAGLQVGIINMVQLTFAGIQLGVYNKALSGGGIQVGVINEINFPDTEAFLIQIGCVNMSGCSSYPILPILRATW